MPVYEYEPTLKSEHDAVSDCCFFETLQSLSESLLQSCPTCGREIHRAVSSFSYAVKSTPAPRTAALGKGLFQSTQDASSSTSPASESTAKRAARMAMRHICASGCRH